MLVALPNGNVGPLDQSAYVREVTSGTANLRGQARGWDRSSVSASSRRLSRRRCIGSLMDRWMGTTHQPAEVYPVFPPSDVDYTAVCSWLP
jgi:hypothetical protein